VPAGGDGLGHRDGGRKLREGVAAFAEDVDASGLAEQDRLTARASVLDNSEYSTSDSDVSTPSVAAENVELLDEPSDGARDMPMKAT
jgi:hypothetical protein